MRIISLLESQPELIYHGTSFPGLTLEKLKPYRHSEGMGYGVWGVVL